MRWLRKLNRGFAALVLVILVLVGYRAILSQTRRQEAQTLERLAEDYLATAMNTEFLTTEVMEAYLTSGDSIDEFVESATYTAYYDRVKSSLLAFYPSDGKYLDYALNRLEQKWRGQLQSRELPSFSYTAQNVEDIRFVDDQAALSINVYYDISSEKDTSGTTMLESILFIKQNGEWKLLVADFNTDFRSAWGY